jgi:hypothetical protein
VDKIPPARFKAFIQETWISVPCLRLQYGCQIHRGFVGMKPTALVRMSVSVPIIGTGRPFAWTVLSASAPALLCMLVFAVVFGGTSRST